MLRPVGAAVEKAGGLPQLNIQLDNRGLDRKPSIEDKPHPPVSHDQPPADDSDALLELLCDEEDDILPPALTGIQTQQDSGQPVGVLSFDSKFERLKKELLSEGGQNGNGDEAQGGTKNGNGGPVYENTRESDSHHKVPGNEDELTNAPMFDGTDQRDSETFDLRHNECYDSVSASNSCEPPPTHSPLDKKDLYENLDDLEKYIKEESGHVPANGREYEDLDNIFADNTNEEGHYYDIPDGGMLSRQDPPPEPEQIELAEVLPFKNLPPLVCTAHLGDEVAMRKLADTAASVLREVVKHIHSSLGKWVGVAGWASRTS